jgi:hypothetical protein
MIVPIAKATVPFKYSGRCRQNEIYEGPNRIARAEVAFLRASELHEIVLKLVSGQCPELRSIFYVAAPYKAGLQDSPKSEKNQFFVAKRWFFG